MAQRPRSLARSPVGKNNESHLFLIDESKNLVGRFAYQSFAANPLPWGTPFHHLIPRAGYHSVNICLIERRQFIGRLGNSGQNHLRAGCSSHFEGIGQRAFRQVGPIKGYKDLFVHFSLPPEIAAQVSHLPVLSLFPFIHSIVLSITSEVHLHTGGALVICNPAGEAIR